MTMDSKQNTPATTTKPSFNRYTLVAKIKPDEIENLRKVAEVAKKEGTFGAGNS
jgi:hypothetical protein